MSASADRVRAHRQRRRHELVDDVASLVAESHEAALFRALAALPPSALVILRDQLADGRCYTDRVTA